MRVLIVGLGRAAKLAVEALSGRSDAAVVAGVDPAPGVSLPNGVPVYRSLGDVPRDLAIDLAVVATPTPSHGTVCLELIDGDLDIAAIACEKPLALGVGEVEDLLRRARERGRPLRVLYHYAHAAEVLWAAEHLDELVSRHGNIRDAVARFEDAYESEIDEREHVLVSSWHDSGINALSVLARLVDLKGIIDTDVHLEMPSAGAATIALASGEARIYTRWDVRAEVKRTTVRFDDDAALELDHPTQTATLAGRVVFRGEGFARLERYRRLMDAHVGGNGDVYDDRTTISLHSLLDAAA